MKLTALIALGLAAIVAGQDAPAAPKMPKGPGGMPKGAGGVKGPSQGKGPASGKGPAGPPGAGGAGGSPPKICGLSCLAPAVKNAGCKFPSPPPKPAGTPTEGGAPPKMSIDPAALMQTRDCFCGNAGVKEAVNTCVPQECAKTGGSSDFIVKMFSTICSAQPPSSGGGKGGAPGGGKGPKSGGVPKGGAPGGGKGPKSGVPKAPSS